MANVTIEARLGSDGKSYLYDNNNKIVTTVTIKKNTNMEISIGSGFSGTAEISAFKLYGVNADGTKNASNLIGTWLRTNPTAPPSTEVSVSATANGAIEVVDTDRETDEELFFFAITVTDGGAHYDSDPQLKVKKATA